MRIPTFCIWWSFLLVCILTMLIFISKVKAEEPLDPTNIVGIEFNNDYFVPGGKDRFLTNQMFLKVPYGDDAFTVGNDMYTPTDKRGDAIEDSDRPWDGHTYVEWERRFDIEEGEHRTLAWRLGAVGPASGTDKLQKWFHNDLGWGADPAWSTQNPSELAAEFIYAHHKTTRISALLGEGWLTDSYGIRVGNVIDEFFLREQLTRSLWRHVFGYVGMEGRGVLYNTHLDGRLFRDNIYTVDKEWFVASTWAGVAFKISNLYLGYKYQYQTKEFKTQDGRHTFGSITLGYEW